MKKNELLDLKTKSVDEMKRMLLDLQDEIGKAKIARALNKEKNTNLVKNKKKQIARIMTFMSMKGQEIVKEVAKNG